MILHNDRPEDLETPVKYFDSWVTPIDAFFVRQHLPRPAAIDPGAYRLNVTGLVSKPLEISLADLQKLPQHTVPATLECTGNGRAFFTPKLPGIQWGRGAVGNAEWSGPRLSDVLKLAGVDPSAKFLEIDGADTPVLQTPDFVRCMPMEKGAPSGHAAGAQNERRVARDARVSGAPDCTGLGRHELGEMGGPPDAGGEGERRVLHEPGLPVPEVQPRRPVLRRARRSWKSSKACR